MNIPCVVNTRNGTRLLRTGDWVRVDGTTGKVQLLKGAQRNA
jgi:pyruvate,water dikinase